MLKIDSEKKNGIIPILIMAAARSGATSLINMIDAIPEVANIEHKLHHGGHEAKLYGYYRFYGDFSDIDKYIDFLYHYASEDYFQLAKGDIDYHLKNRQRDFFSFFFNMMDRYCLLNDKKNFVVKIEPALLTDKKAFNYLVRWLHSRYSTVKYIRIQRALYPAVQSFLHMEGKHYGRRVKWPFKYFYMLTYVQRWFKVYELKHKALAQKNVLDIDFETFITKRELVKGEIMEYLGLSATNEDKVPDKDENYEINTSFTKHRPKKMSILDRCVVAGYYNILKIFPGLVFASHYFSAMVKKPASPMHRRLLKYQYFRDELIEEFKGQGAHGLLNSLSHDEQ